MNASTARFTSDRISGLALIVMVALGLGYLHSAGGADTVSVPSGARAGELTMKSCTYEGRAADCGTLVVRENRHDPDSRLIAIPVKRIPAKSTHPGAPVFGFIGGPGHSNFKFTAMTRFANDHDVVLVGYRGVDGSVRLDCPEVVSSREHSRDWLTSASLESDADALRACADRLSDDGVDLAGYSLPQRVDDIELARRKLGYGKIDLVSESFGTRIAMVYAWRFPQSIHRSVMVGVNPPGHFLWDAKTTGEQIRRYAALCAADEECRKRTPDLTASVHSAYERIPSHWWFLPIKKGNVRTGAFFGLFNATSDGAGPLAGPNTLDTLLAVDTGDAGGAWFVSVAVQAVFPRVQVAGDVAAMGHIDAAAAKRFFASGADRGSVIGAPGTDFVWSGGRLVDAWPSSPDDRLYNRVRDSRVETLLVGGELDFSTPPQVAARELLPHLPNGKQVVIPKLGHTEDFWADRSASTRLVGTFLDTGRVDSSLFAENRLDFTPSTTHANLAEIVLGVLLGLSALTILSLLWLGGRIRRGAVFGRKAGVAVRALFPAIVGLGGWCLGALTVLTAFPTVPLNDGLLAVVSVAPAVAIAVYAGWIGRDVVDRRKGVAALAVLTAATLGAWLGFHVPSNPAAGALTAIVAAIAAANFALIALGIVAPARAAAAAPASPPREVVPDPT